MKKQIFLLLLFYLLITTSSAPYLSNANLNNNPLIPVSNKIVIGMLYAGYNVSEVDVPKNTNFTIVFVNSEPYAHDLTILKPDIFVNELNCTNISSTYYDLKLGPISNKTISGTWLSPSFDTWILYYSSFSEADYPASHSLIKVGNPTQTAPYIPRTNGDTPGFEGFIVLVAVIGYVFYRKKIQR